MSNGIKYAKTKVDINLKRAGSSEYIVTITDDGKGIDSKNLQNIFTRYYKGEDGHFGIGLAVVKSSADYIGAKIEVSSELGKGTSFTCILPQSYRD